MKITFLSVCSDYDLFKDYIYTVGKSFEKTNDFKIDWNIFTNKKDILKFEKINVIFNNIENTNLYNMFISRLYKILELKDSYDIICLADLDILFLGNVYKDICDVYKSDCVVGCQRMNLNHTRKMFPEVKCYSDYFLEMVKDRNYCNTGFSIINTHNVSFDKKEIEDFVKKIKDHTFCYDEAFFTFQKQFIIDDLQINKDVLNDKYDFKVVHFSFGRYLLKYDNRVNKFVKKIYKKYIKEYYNITTDNVRKIIRWYL